MGRGGVTGLGCGVGWCREARYSGIGTGIWLWVGVV